MMNEMEKEMSKSKRQERWERKKRKIRAFLEVSQLNEDDKVHSKSLPTPTKASNGKHEDMDSKTTKESAINIKCTAPKLPFVVVGDEELDALRAKLKQKQAAALQKSKLFVTLDHIKVTCEVCSRQQNHSGAHTGNTAEKRSLLFPVDLQHLLLYAIQLGKSSYIPRWCKLLRPSKLQQVVVLEVAGVSKQMFLEHQSAFPQLKEEDFIECVEMVSPLQYNSSFLEEIFRVPMSWCQSQQQHPDHWKDRKRHQADVIRFRQEMCASDQPESNEPFSRLDILLSHDQMAAESFFLPEDKEKHPDCVFSKDSFEPVTANSPMFAIDCEMCLTSIDKLELSWIAVVNEKLETIYETLVKPYNPIMNYLTRFSGITKAGLADVTTRLEDVQAKLRQLLPPDAILCGHSINNDFEALKMYHPYVIDTSVIYNLSGMRRYKASLKILTQLLLSKTIQDDTSGHNPVEDAYATMELVLLKLKTGPYFGDIILGGPLAIPAPAADNTADVSTDSPQLKRRRLTEKTDLNVSSASNNCDILKPSPADEGDISTAAHTGTREDADVANKDSGVCQKMVYFQRPGTKYILPIFEILSQVNRKATMIGPEATISPWRTKADTNCNPFVDAETRKTCMKACRLAIQEESFLVWAHFPWKGESSSDHESVQRNLQKIDKSLKRVVKCCREQTLVVVLFTGHASPNSASNAICMMKIT